MDDSQKKFLQIIGIAVTAYVGYRLLKGDTPKKAVSNTTKIVSDASETAEKTIKKTYKRLIKGSPEAKAYMKKIAGMRKQHGRKKKPKAKKLKHKGHATKKGLSQNQKLVSKEPHEVVYIKKKIAKEEDAAISAYKKGKMQKGKKHEDAADQIYEKNYHKLAPEIASKIPKYAKRMKKTDGAQILKKRIKVSKKLDED